jgi:hypothetical protein
MYQFHAEVVETYSEFEGVLTVHFDEGGEHYLQLQAPTEGFEEEYGGMGMVYVEVDDQGTSAYDCFPLAELRRHSLFMVFNKAGVMVGGKVKVTFDLDDKGFEELREALGVVFRFFEDFKVLSD